MFPSSGTQNQSRSQKLGTPECNSPSSEPYRIDSSAPGMNFNILCFVPIYVYGVNSVLVLRTRDEGIGYDYYAKYLLVSTHLALGATALGVSLGLLYNQSRQALRVP
jgi:hypothetical protein